VPGGTFKVVALNNSDDNCFIQSAKLNGKPYTKAYITHDDIMRGGVLEFIMGSEPTTFGSAPEDRPN
jgi:putative alpha-1,2-mannosidase